MTEETCSGHYPASEVTWTQVTGSGPVFSLPPYDESLPKICQECGNDEVCEGYACCSECLEQLEHEYIDHDFEIMPSPPWHQREDRIDPYPAVTHHCPECLWTLIVPMALYGDRAALEIEIREHVRECPPLLARARALGLPV